MQRRHARFSLAALALSLASCLENEEEITVHPDGSLEVIVRAHGHVEDLTDGAPVPLHGPWSAADDTTQRWVESVGRGTSGAEIAARVAQGALRELVDDDGKLELRARALFPSVDAWSSLPSPTLDPYASAYLARDVELDVRRVGNRTVFRFERTFRGREGDGSGICDGAADVLPEEARQQLEDGIDPGPAAWDLLSRTLAGRAAEQADDLVRDALAPLYLFGDASLDPAAITPLVQRAQDACAEPLVAPRLIAVWRALLSQQDGDALHRLQEEVREVLRRTLRQGLIDAGVSEGVRHAVAERLEWRFASIDHDADLADENFTVQVSMPGTLVQTNAKETDGATCRWRFEAEALTQGDVVMRAVSVLID